MDRIEYLANVSVRRGCAFAWLGVVTVMFGLSYDVVLCLRSGAVLVSLIAAALGLMALRARGRNHRSTEVWAMLRNGADLPEGYPGGVVNEALRRIYIRYADMTALVAAAMCVAAVVAAFVRR